MPRCLLRGPFAHLLTNRSGLAAIEFAFIGPVLLLAIMAATDLGIAFYTNMQVQNSAQAGSEYAVAHGFSATAMASAVTATTPGSGISATPAPSQFCGCPTNDAIAPVSCGSTCADGTGAGAYVKVTATKTYTPMFPYPLLPASFSLTAVSTVRIQ